MKLESIINVDMGKLTALVNGALKFDHIPRPALEHGIFKDRHYEEELNTVAVIDGEPVGLLAGVFRPEKEVANVKLIAVRNDARNRGIAAALMDDFERKAVDRDALRISLGYEGALYFFGGIDPQYTPAVVMFMRRGYRRAGDGFFMKVNLRKPVPPCDEIERRLTKEGIRFVRPGREEKNVLTGWVREHFQDGWAHEASLAFLNDPVNLWTARAGDRIIGFAAYCATNWNYFGPTGVAEELRGRGAGTVLLNRCLTDMQSRGIVTAFIPTGEHRISFYHRAAGARVGRVFWRMVKELRPESEKEDETTAEAPAPAL